MQVFVRVVEARSFSRAAEISALPRSSVTGVVKKLETHLGVRLLNRNTRSLSLTAQGSAYYRDCVAILDEIAAAEGSLRETQVPRGRVRIDMPGAVARILVIPRLAEFQARFPEVELVLGLSDKPADLIGEGIDCAVRVGETVDSRLVARRLGMFQWIVCASPAYLARRGTPLSVGDLRDHCVVHYQLNATGRPMDWRFNVEGESLSAELKSQFTVNETAAYIHCGLAGLGLVRVPRYIVRDQLEAGALIEVLPDFRAAPIPLSVLYPQNRNQPVAVRAVIDWIVEIFAQLTPAPASID